MPNVVMEAQLMGTPVVAPRVGGVPDCIVDGETGFIVEVDDYEGYPRRCIELLTDKELRRRMGSRGSGYMREFFSREAMASRYLDLLAVLETPLRAKRTCLGGVSHRHCSLVHDGQE